MRLLLDTHVWLWALTEPERLSTDGRRAVSAAENSVFVSSASYWELAIKVNSGKLRLDIPVEDLPQYLPCIELPVTFDHARVAGGLPLLHRDLFDRMLVAQARLDELTLVTRDAQIARYGVPILAA